MKYPKPTREARAPRPLKRSGRKGKRTSRRRKQRKARLHDADRLFSQYVRGRDGWACVRCHSPFSPQCAHLISRSYRAIRWNPENATTLCQSCHVFFTHRPLEWIDWCEERWPGRYAILKAQALAGVKHVDYDEVCASLREAIGLRGSDV